MGYNNVPGQPGGYGGPGSYGAPASYGSPAPNSYLVWAILTTIFCCMPFGVVSIVFAAQVSSKWNAGDVQGAMEYSTKAKNWAIASASVGVVAIIAVIIFDIVLLQWAQHAATR